MISIKSLPIQLLALPSTQYILYDMLGKQVTTSKLSMENSSERINTSNLNAGIYQIALLQENRIIQHLTLSVVK